MKVRHVAFALLLCALSASCASWAADDCAPERYFAPDDNNNTSPLRAPHAEFRKTQQLAQNGVATEERNLAAFYESGYLVSACAQKAAYWYAKAAQDGDAISKAWIARHTSMQAIRKGSECFGDACHGSASSGPQKTVVQLGPGGAYTAVVRINDKTVRGLVDTGATFVAMSARLAAELGISYKDGAQVRLNTANGAITARRVTLASMTVGNITLRDVEAVVDEAEHPLLIGMSFLSRVTMNTTGSGITLEKP